MKQNIEISGKNAFDLEDKKEAIEGLLKLSPKSFERVAQIIKSPKAENLLTNYWLLIKSKI